MRQDIKHLIESTESWQKLNPVDSIETKELPRIKEAINQMQAQDPVFFELMKAFVMAKQQGDEPTASVVLEMIDLHKHTKK
jgi:hypothetical protein